MTRANPDNPQTIDDGSRQRIDAIDALLPQTQCGRCGHPGCRPYAEAIARGEEPINRCPPGGEETIEALARLLDVPARPLDPDYGEYTPRRVASIREDECIGCTKCIQACPTDAILGAAKQMHTVLEAECTGCELCIEPCPVDCIDMIEPSPQREAEWQPLQAFARKQGREQADERLRADYWRQRFLWRERRRQRDREEREARRRERMLANQEKRSRQQTSGQAEDSPAGGKSRNEMQREIHAAVARARARKARLREQERSGGRQA